MSGKASTPIFRACGPLFLQAAARHWRRIGLIYSGQAGVVPGQKRLVLRSGLSRSRSMRILWIGEVGVNG